LVRALGRKLKSITTPQGTIKTNEKLLWEDIHSYIFLTRSSGLLRLVPRVSYNPGYLWLIAFLWNL